MSLWKVAWRSIQQRALVSTLTVVSMGLGVALVVAVLVVYGVVDQSFHRGGEGYDLIVGAKGGREQLVLNTVFYLSQPVGNIPYSFYEELTEGKFAADVETAIPVCMGHTYQGFRVVGTVPEMFTELKYRGDQSYEFAAGRELQGGEPLRRRGGRDRRRRRPACRSARSFRPSTASSEGGRVHKETFRVVGILAPTGTPVDRAIFVNMEGFYDIHQRGRGGTRRTREQARRTREHTPTRTTRTSKSPPSWSAFRRADADTGRTDVVAKLINDGKVAQAVVPARVIADLFEGVVGKLQWILLGMAVLTVIEAGIGIMVSIYNSMSDRRHEIAVMRALGASRLTVMVIILLESILLSLMGGAIGLAARPRRHLGLLAADRRLDRRGRRPVAVPMDRVDPDSRPGRAGLGGGLPAGPGGLPHRRGEVVDYHAVEERIGMRDEG